ncbi:MAG: peptide chain release factor N(5)-glutamine methyltransferase [Ignavibacteria bacterium]|nr:peptide chain release factor N(5)-glutamine methyltransferase [Ignavibacteria bacterium]
MQTTVSEFVSSARQRLEEAGIDEARLTAELIMCEVLECGRMDLYLNFDKPLQGQETQKLEKFLSGRLSGEPLQYIFGHANFFGYEFFVDSSVLIPRPETELIVDAVLKSIESAHRKSAEILEIGSGSGCISIALAKQLDDRGVDYIINSLDVSGPAIETAKKNMNRHLPYNGKLSFHQKDVFSISSLKRRVDYIISNPPYISADEYERLPGIVKNREPRTALTDSADGLSFIRKLISLFTPFKNSTELFCEISFGQNIEITNLLDSAGMEKYDFIADLSGIPRVLHLKG